VIVAAKRRQLKDRSAPHVEREDPVPVVDERVSASARERISANGQWTANNFHFPARETAE
jgi:hypothetical protein